MLKKIVLIGAGGFGREVATSLIGMINWYEPTHEFLGFLDDGAHFSAGMKIDGYPWLGNRYWILDHIEDVVCTCTVGNAHIKKQIQSELMQKNVRFESIIEKTAYIAPSSKIGPGCVLYGGVKVSVNCNIGAGVLLNDGVKIGHDVTIGDYTSIMPDSGISGGCQVGDEVEIGGHAFIVPGRKIGDRARIAAGSIVFSNVKAATTVLGNPAKRMKELE